MAEQVVLIAGPTASGKSALALVLAERLGAMIVNADSMQVYADLDILTARPGAEDLARAEHRLYGHVDPARRYSVAQWLEEVGAVLDEAAERQQPAIIVGGTGLYFTALTQGLSSVPPIPPEIREKWRAAASAPAGWLHANLAERDPAMAERLKPGDTQRLIRALEVIEGTGQSLLHWQQTAGPARVGPEAPRLVLAPPRPWLHARIGERFDAMIAAGAVEEARRVCARQLAPALPAMKAIGLRELGALPADLSGLDHACERSKTETRRFAKRQETFFRGQLGDWPRADPSSSTPEQLAAPLAELLVTGN
ncbi:tRNA (adenosine(37)-N6)-dimethylallyltransferase MiaA [Stappia indica]|uniref:tRNA (adenosine(37)-N6)-dimethylallyltransferase MiaA n=1 Tax=Stappia indica TaxID=538381 RepID=UPI001CD7BC93|nr:tRNA (adenosine(37)-N6)-dimethylallyltransferase MiaA [Stappia indica]MCA1298925.1 tRNA (adenosine(37)-N6)-dimethylallyltransferase MiaA [Stappia indica]